MPDRNRCSVCCTTVKPFKYESRPTGAHGEIQQWPYCYRCFDEFVAIRPEGDFSEAKEVDAEPVGVFAHRE
jgi:hypothetical protein